MPVNSPRKRERERERERELGGMAEWRCGGAVGVDVMAAHQIPTPTLSTAGGIRATPASVLPKSPL